MINKSQGVKPVVHSFRPISNEFSRILILGTMPSVQSRKANFYYSHPRNRFWPVLSGCFGQQMPQSIEGKTKLLLENGIALWDVLASCEIHGSDDSTIRKPAYNDIATFISDKPIAKILCNGKKAHSFCLHLDLPVPILYLPSTSPANAAWNIGQLMEARKAHVIF